MLVWVLFIPKVILKFLVLASKATLESPQHGVWPGICCRNSSRRNSGMGDSGHSSHNCGVSHNGGVGCSNRYSCHIWHCGWLYLWSCGWSQPQRGASKVFLVEGQKPNEGIDQDTPELANVDGEEDEEGPPDINPDEGPQRAITIMQRSYTLTAELGSSNFESYGGRIPQVWNRLQLKRPRMALSLRRWSCSMSVAALMSQST